MVQYDSYDGMHGMEQAAHLSWFPVKILKSSEQSSVDYSLPAHTFVSFFYQVAALLPYPTACFLVTPPPQYLDGLCWSGTLPPLRERRIGRKDFSCHLLMTFPYNLLPTKRSQPWRFQSLRPFRSRQFPCYWLEKTSWGNPPLAQARRSPIAFRW